MVAIAVGAVACVGIGIGTYWLQDSGVTRDHFARIRPGMSDSDVATVIGRPPDSSVLMLGRVAGPDAFVPNDGQGRWYHYREWDGARITIVTVSDPDSGLVLCRYSAQGYLDRIVRWRPW